MPKPLLIAACLALALTGSAFAQSQPPAEAAPGADAKAAPDAGDKAAVRPEAAGSSGEANTGGVTKQSREIIRDNEQPPGSGGPQARGTSSDTASTRNGAVGPEMVRAIREQALAAERAAASAPTPGKNESVIADEKKAIADHRENLFARDAERRSSLPAADGTAGARGTGAS